jgi:outer membrane protein TolC
MNDNRHRSSSFLAAWRGAMLGLALLSASMTAAAQSAAPAGGGAPLDPFVLEVAAAAEAYRAAMDFAVPVGPSSPLPPAGTRPAPPYTLDALLALAASGNPGLKADAAGEEAARAEFNSARARRLPTLGSAVNGTYIANPSDPIAIPANAFAPGMPPGQIVLYESSGNALYDFRLTGDLPLYTWGRISLGVDLARTGLGAAALQRQKASHELAVRMRANWDALAYLGRAGEVLALQERIGARLVELSARSLAAGFMTPADMARTRIRVKEIEMAATKLDEKRDRLLSELASMAGLPGLSLGELLPEVPAAGAPRWTEDALWTAAKDGNYDLALSAALLDSRRGLRKLADRNALGLPDIGLHVELSYGGSHFPLVEEGWRDENDYQFTITLGAEGRILGDAVKAGEAARARAQLAQAEAQDAAALRSIRQYIHEAYLGIELAKAELEYAALKQDGWAADLAQERAAIQAGGGSESEYLGLMIEALGGLAEAYGTLAGYRSSVLSLDAVAGSGALQ